MTTKRAREILTRVWVNGECLSANEVMELDAAGEAPTAFAQCMEAAGLGRYTENVMAVEWAGRSFTLRPGMSYQVADNAEPHRSTARQSPQQRIPSSAMPAVRRSFGLGLFLGLALGRFLRRFLFGTLMIDHIDHLVALAFDCAPYQGTAPH